MPANGRQGSRNAGSQSRLGMSLSPRRRRPEVRLVSNPPSLRVGSKCPSARRLPPHRDFRRNDEPPWSFLGLGLGAAPPCPLRRRQSRRRRPARPAAKPAARAPTLAPDCIEPLNNSSGGLFLQTETGRRSPTSFPFFLCERPLCYSLWTRQGGYGKRSNRLDQPATPVISWKHPYKLSFITTKWLYEPSSRLSLTCYFDSRGTGVARVG